MKGDTSSATTGCAKHGAAGVAAAPPACKGGEGQGACARLRAAQCVHAPPHARTPTRPPLARSLAQALRAPPLPHHQTPGAHLLAAAAAVCRPATRSWATARRSRARCGPRSPRGCGSCCGCGCGSSSGCGWQRRGRARYRHRPMAPPHWRRPRAGRGCLQRAGGGGVGGGGKEAAGSGGGCGGGAAVRGGWTLGRARLGCVCGRGGPPAYMWVCMCV